MNGSIRPQIHGDNRVGRGTFQEMFVGSRTLPSSTTLGDVARRKLRCAMSRVFTICLLMSLATALVYGQGGAYGTILGTVTDNSGAVLANARVDVTNAATNATNHVQTSDSGDYTVPYLQPGTYRVTVQAEGFQKSITGEVTLQVAQQARVNVTMKPGAISQTVE